MALVLNYLIAFLLLVTILYCWRLNKRIVELHRGKKELLTLLKAFDQAILRAEESTKTLKHTSMNVGKALQEDVDKARFLVEDLNFMIDRAASVTDKLEKHIQASRHIAPVDSGASYFSQPNNMPPPRPVFNSDTGERIPPRMAPGVSSSPMPSDGGNKSKRTGIELLLEKLAGRKDGPEANKVVPAGKRIPYQSPEELGMMQMPAGKAESDLLKLLKSTR